MNTTKNHWRFSRGEWIGWILAFVLIIAFGVNLELRTALRRVPRTDLGVFASASMAVWSGENPYTITDWHGWHYQYAPTLAILFLPLAEPVPTVPATPAPGETRKEKTSWGYRATAQSSYVGLHKENAGFFRTVAIWYGLSVVFVILSAHALACTLEGRAFRSAPPEEKTERRRWWALRLLPLLVCAGSLGTDFSRGQVDVLMLLAVAAGLYLAAAGRSFAGGLWLSFPATVKLFPPFLLLYPFWRRRWRMASGIVAGLVLSLFILPAAVLGTGRTIELYRVWTEVLAKPALGHGTDTSRLSELTGMTSTDNQSLLATLHNWRYCSLPPKQRPATPAPWERNAVYAAGALMLLGIGAACGFRRDDSGRALLVIAGLLIGLAFVVSPVVHNFYYLLMLPLIAALLDEGLIGRTAGNVNWRLLTPVILFLAIDLLARLPGIGPVIRDAGAPLLSLLYLMGAGIAVLLKRTDAPGPALKECCLARG